MSQERITPCLLRMVASWNGREFYIMQIQNNHVPQSTKRMSSIYCVQTRESDHMPIPSSGKYYKRFMWMKRNGTYWKLRHPIMNFLNSNKVRFVHILHLYKISLIHNMPEISWEEESPLAGHHIQSWKNQPSLRRNCHAELQVDSLIDFEPRIVRKSLLLTWVMSTVRLDKQEILLVYHLALYACRISPKLSRFVFNSIVPWWYALLFAILYADPETYLRQAIRTWRECLKWRTYLKARNCYIIPLIDFSINP